MDNVKQLKKEIEQELTKRKEEDLLSFYDPLPTQLPFHLSQAQVRYWATGNRSGKTTAGVVDGLGFLLGRHPYRNTPPEGGNIWFVTQTRDHSREAILSETLKWLPKKNYDPEHKIGRIVFTRNDIPDFIEVHHKYKGKLYKNKISFKSQEQGYRVFQSAEKIYVLFDEDIDDERVFSQTRARFGKYPVNIAVTATPMSMKSVWFEDWIKQKVIESPDRYWYSTHGCYKDNYYNSKEEREHFADDVSGFAQASTMLTGKRMPPGGLVFPFFDKEIQMMKVAPPPEYLAKCTIYRGIDWAGANGVTGTLWIAVDKGGYKTVFREYQGTAGYNTHIKNITEKSFINGRPMKIKWTICDWATIGTYIKGFDIRREFAIGGDFRHRSDGHLYKIPTILAKKGAGSVELSIEAMTRALQERDSNGKPILRISPECPVFIQQIEQYARHEANSLDDKTRIIKRKDHLIDCWKYMEMQGMRYVNPTLIVTPKPHIVTVTGLPQY